MTRLSCLCCLRLIHSSRGRHCESALPSSSLATKKTHVGRKTWAAAALTGVIAVILVPFPVICSSNSDPYYSISRMGVRSAVNETNDRSAFMAKLMTPRTTSQPSWWLPADSSESSSSSSSSSWLESNPASSKNFSTAVSRIHHILFSDEEDHEASAVGRKIHRLDDEKLSMGGFSQGDDEASSPLFPVVYRYYGRNQALSHSYGAIPFLMLGPNVDHWKVAGKELSSRGYNVMACERVPTDDQRKPFRHVALSDSALLVLQLLDALKWNKVVLVACDSQSVAAIEAALQLAPHRIAGVVLCGRIPRVDELFPRDGSEETRRRLANRYASLEQYLKENLRCPFTVVWDGAIPPLVDAPGIDETENYVASRSLILGGGAAPHRRRPELFAWALTRFVEEQVDPIRRRQELPPKRIHERDHEDVNSDQLPKSKPLPFYLAELFSPGTMVVCGRILATALFYGIAMKTFIYQFENIRWGMLNIKAKIDMVTSIPQAVKKTVSGARKVGFLTWLPRIIGNAVCGLLGFLPFCSRGLVNRCDDDGAASDHNSPNETLEKGDSDKHADGKQDSIDQNDDQETIDLDGSDQNADPDSKQDNSDEPEEAPPSRPSFFLDHVIV
jgi:pimeloyl-ACP methyl ester carboxylesterase